MRTAQPAPAAAPALGSPRAASSERLREEPAAPPAAQPGQVPPGKPGTPALTAAEPAAEPAPEASKGPSPGEHYREIQRQRSALGRQLAQLRGEQERLAQDRTTLAADAELAKKDPVGFAIKNGGLTPEQLIERIAQGETAVAEEEAKQSDLERKVAELEHRDRQRDADAAAKAQAAVIGQFKDKLNEHLAAHAEQYPLIAPVAEFLGHSAADLVYAVMDLHYRRTAGPDGNNGELLEFDQACERVNRHYGTRAERFLNAPPLQARQRHTTDSAPGAATAGDDSAGEKPGGPSRAHEPSGSRPNPGSPAASPPAGGPSRAPDRSGPRPTTLNNALDSAPAVTGSGVPRRARGRLAIDDAILAASAKKVLS